MRKYFILLSFIVNSASFGMDISCNDASSNNDARSITDSYYPGESSSVSSRREMPGGQPFSFVAYDIEWLFTPLGWMYRYVPMVIFHITPPDNTVTFNLTHLQIQRFR